MTEKVTVCVDLDRRLAETVNRLWPRLGMESRSEKHKIEEEKEDFEVLRGRW